MSQLAKMLNVVRVSNAVAAGVTAVNATHVDMQGWDGVLFVAAIGTLTAGQVTSLKGQSGALANDSDMADLAGTGSGNMADGDSNKVLMLDIYRPQARYVRAVVLRATQNAVVDGIFALLYQGDKIPPAALDATIKGLVALASPALGTP